VPDLNTNIVAGVNRNQTDDGWLVRATVNKTFFDKDYGNSRQNSYVQAYNYSFDKFDETKRKYAVSRNITIVKKFDKKGNSKSYVRITKPLGGYKLFEIDLTIPDNPTTGSASAVFMNGNKPTKIVGEIENIEALRVAIMQANEWFIEEREKFQSTIDNKNANARQQTTMARHARLFGDPYLNARPKGVSSARSKQYN